MDDLVIELEDEILAELERMAIENGRSVEDEALFLIREALDRRSAESSAPS